EDYRVVSVAIHPTIAQYNGLYTLDTYNNSFPLEYKHEFREIIAPELEKNKTLKSYFDTWGGRVYMYVAELGKYYIFTKDSNRASEELEINIEKLKDMGGGYVVSSLRSENREENGLIFDARF